MKFSIQNQAVVLPKLCDLIPGTMVLVDDVVYIKVDKQKKEVNQHYIGIPRITWTADYCVLFNPDNGKLLELSAITRLNVVTPTYEGGSITVEGITNSTKLYQFLRTNQGNM